ncbi:MAG: nucleotidyltransferase family protein [Acidobacteria bacterium]|nr:nucleotidyltransferase family protein [Acidobacteriota bacterium]
MGRHDSDRGDTPLIAGILLAAGQSRRMGRNKLLLPFGDVPLVAHGLAALASSSVHPVVCVLGWQAGAVRKAVEGVFPDGRVTFVVNRRFGEGRSTSIQAGLAALPDGAKAALFLPADVPLVRAKDVDAVADRYRRTAATIVVAVGRCGELSHPVLFARACFPELMALVGDVGGRRLIRARWGDVEKVSLPGPEPFDVDTPGDYQRLLEHGA